MNMMHLATFDCQHVKNPFSFAFVKSYVYWDLLGVNAVLEIDDVSEQFGLYCAGGEL